MDRVHDGLVHDVPKQRIEQYREVSVQFLFRDGNGNAGRGHRARHLLFEAVGIDWVVFEGVVRRRGDVPAAGQSLFHHLTEGPVSVAC